MSEQTMKCEGAHVSFVDDRNRVFDSDSEFIRIKYDFGNMVFEDKLLHKIRVGTY